MVELRWSWLGVPYFGCAAMILGVALAAALIRGDRVLRLGVIGAAVTALPWATCQGLAALTDDPATATRLLRLGEGPVALVGPSLLLVLLGVSGQLERYRWIARLAGIIGGFFMVAAWTTSWIVPDVQVVPSGMFYVSPGPLTGVHISQLALWLGVGLVIVRRSTPPTDRRRTTRLWLGVIALAAIGSMDVLLLYRIWGVYPIAWLPATVAAGLALWAVVRTDLVRPQGFDRGVAVELVGFAAAMVVTGALAIALGDGSPLEIAAWASVAWAVITAVTWELARARPVRVAGERALEQFVADVVTLDDEPEVALRLAELWKRAVGIEVVQAWAASGAGFVPIGPGVALPAWTIDHDVIAWLVERDEPFAVTDLATMKLGEVRGRIEALGAAHGASLIVPLVDRGELVGLVEATFAQALRENERGLVAESAHAAARALTFVGLAGAAARERDTEREVEVADALRLQASASRDAELGRWVVAAEYRTAPRTTGAGWSAIELADGRLALLATEAQAHGVAAALATAALTGAFAAAAAGPITLDDLVAAMQASADGVMRGGEPVAAFLAILDAAAGSIAWACAGHPGAVLVGPIAAVDSGLPVGSGVGPRPQATSLGGGPRVAGASLTGATRGTMAWPLDTLLVVASTALRGDDDERWQHALCEVASASGRLATVLVENALRAGEPHEDLLAVVVRSR